MRETPLVIYEILWYSQSSLGGLSVKQCAWFVGLAIILVAGYLFIPRPCCDTSRFENPEHVHMVRGTPRSR